MSVTTQKRLHIFMLVTSLVGVGFSLELTRIHYQTHTQPNFHSICAVNDTVNCETVARSPYAVLWGLPVSVWGTIAYALFGALAVSGLVTKHAFSGVILGGALGSVGVAAWLAYVSHVIIGSLCPYCAVLYVVGLLLLSGAIALLVATRLAPYRAIGADMRYARRHPAWCVGMASLAVVPIALCLTLISPYWLTSSWKDVPTLESGQTTEGTHWMGARDPLLIIVEFSDYQCPFCRAAHRNVRHMIADYSDTVQLIHRHMPMDPRCNRLVKQVGHMRACAFSEAAICAGEQGKFWDMNDGIYAMMDVVDSNDIDVMKLVTDLDMDHEAFTDCLQSNRPLDVIAKDVDAAIEWGVTATPTYFLGRQPFLGGFSKNTLASWVEHAQKRRSLKNAEHGTDDGVKTDGGVPEERD